MKPIIPSFTMSERSIITPGNPRGFNMDIASDPIATAGLTPERWMQEVAR